MKKKIIRSLLFGIVPVLILLYYYFFGQENNLAMSCVFYKTTGWQCPGCGGQRAVHAILNGKFIEGIKYNPLIFFYLFLLLYLYVLIVEGYVLKNEKFLRRYGLPDRFATVFLIVVLLFFVLRNIDKII